MTKVTKTTDFGDRVIYAYTDDPKPSDYTVGERVNYRSPIFPEGIKATVSRIDEFFVHIRFDRDPVRNYFAAYPQNLTKVIEKPEVDAAESLLKRALHACNTAKRFKFAVFDDSYKLAADIESYLKQERINGKDPQAD